MSMVTLYPFRALPDLSNCVLLKYYEVPHNYSFRA
jgi:hypothetical protein